MLLVNKMEGKPTKVHHVPLNLSLQSSFAAKEKIVSIGDKYDKAYILKAKPS